MSFADDFLTILFDYHGGYRLMRQMIRMPTLPRGRKISRKEINDATLRVTLSRLRKRGLVDNKMGIWAITKKGRVYCEKKIFRRIRIKERRAMPKNMIITFDVPEKEKYKRNWLRTELVILGFMPLQKSVWFGPAPLPKDFIEDLSERDLLCYIKFFEAKEKEVV